jgi:hypothetical protein
LPVLNNTGGTPSQPGEYRIHKVEITQRGIGQSSQATSIIKELQSYSRHAVRELLQLRLRDPARKASFIRKGIRKGSD